MLKKKNLVVISISVCVVFLVILSSFLGLVIYFQWHQLDLAYKYYEALEESDTLSYAKNIELDSVKIKPGFRNIGLAEGRIKNKGNRTVISTAIRLDFLDILEKPVHSCVIYPLEPFQPPRFFKKMRFTYFAFIKGPSLDKNKVVVFKYPLWRCPKKFTRMLGKQAFSNKPGEWSGKVSAEIIRVKLKPI